jgi:hypothetical protein
MRYGSCQAFLAARFLQITQPPPPMDFSLILSNILTPPILFFFLGVAACLFRSSLEIPQPLPKFFSLYLLLSIGFKGGAELHKNGFTADIAWTLGAGVFMALFVPAWTFLVLRRKLDIPNAGAVASAYGSVSAVTFIAASTLLSQLNIPFGGHMIAALALMDSPAIITGIALVGWLRERPADQPKAPSWTGLFHNAFANGSVFLLCGALLIGIITGESGSKALAPFTSDIFRGMLCLFLLDMGLVSGRQLGEIRKLGLFPVAFAILAPMLNALIAGAIAYGIRIGPGDAFLFVGLCASASYIAVPAAMRIAVPDANPGVYVTMALALTFPFNILLGLPLYLSLIQHFWK